MNWKKLACLMAALAVVTACEQTPTEIGSVVEEERGGLEPANSKTKDLGGGNYTCFGRPATFVGGTGNDVMIGAPGNVDVIVGLGGDDTITLNDDGDVACGGPGLDTITGGLGNDLITGEAGRDILDGGGGIDLIVGGPGVNTLTGGDGNDRLIGGNEADSLRGGAGNDFLHGKSGPNVIEGGDGDDTMDAGAHADKFFGDGGTDTVRRLNCRQGDTADSVENVLRTDCPDADLDGVFDSFDNCPNAANADQADGDGDGKGDVCDFTPVAAGATADATAFPGYCIGCVLRYEVTCPAFEQEIVWTDSTTSPTVWWYFNVCSVGARAGKITTAGGTFRIVTGPLFIATVANPMIAWFSNGGTSLVASFGFPTITVVD